jgi:hypothetical protein
MSVLDLHVTGVTSDGNLWHTIRFADGSWQSFFGNVKVQVPDNDPGSLYAVDCAVDGDNLHVIIATDINDTTNAGQLWHTIRFADGSWQPSFGNVKAQVPDNDPGSFYDDIGCAAAFGLLHVCGITTGDGKPWHTIRFADGSWQPFFGDVDAQVPRVPGAFFGVDCAVVDNRNLQVVSITSGDPTANPEDLYHTIRFVDGNWQPFGDVKAQESNNPGTFIGISCSAAGGDLHVIGTTSDGKLWHTIRFANGSWQPSFGNVKAQVRDNDPGPFSDNVSCAVADNGDLHVVAATDVHNAANPGKLWHTIRFADGSWQSFFGSVEAQVPDNNPGPFKAVGIASGVNFIV